MFCAYCTRRTAELNLLKLKLMGGALLGSVRISNAREEKPPSIYTVVYDIIYQYCNGVNGSSSAL